MINVTKTYLPPFEEYTQLLKRAWNKEWITNNGELVQELELKLKERLSLQHLLFTNNGTIALQIAVKALGITKQIITTPFSYVATTNAILWEGCKPVFVDIDPETLCIDSKKIEEAITNDTEAILATHVYGYPCDVDGIQMLAEKYGIKVIYDAAHAFGCVFNGKSVLSYGDISTCSFHATKVFHTVEGGCMVCKDEKTATDLSLLRSFGHISDDYFSIGVNGKNSEFHAAMGLANLNHIDEIIQQRRIISEIYDNGIGTSNTRRPLVSSGLEYNYSYYPIIFEDEERLKRTVDALKKINVSPRRYFYPSLNTLPHTLSLNYSCPVSESISRRVLCLPLFSGLLINDIELIIETVKKNCQ